MKTLFITPPLLQPNTPYAATPLLTAWLRSQGHDAVQADLSLQLLLRLFSKEGLSKLFDRLEDVSDAGGFIEQAEGYLKWIDPVVAFLQGKGPVPDVDDFPEGPYLAHALNQEEQLGWSFRGVNEEDRIRHICSLFLDDIAAAFTLLDPHFGFSRYGEKIAVNLKSWVELDLSDSLVFQELAVLVDEVMAEHSPDLVGLTVPFPGCLLGAVAIANQIKRISPNTKVVLGGGYVNTELRELTDPEIFESVDFICLDSGMRPLLQIANGEQPVSTFVRESGAVKFYPSSGEPVLHGQLPPPTFDGLPLADYFGLFEVLNPVTRLWSDGRWNKLVLAHGCCWSRCAFCDTSIDYICRYDPAAPVVICDWFESVMEESGYNGFHFVDEALPPDVLDGLCNEILSRGLSLEWWGNIRFENRISKELIQKMAAAGCIAVTGGLETCSDRTLKLMRKGITVKGASTVLRNLAEAGILTHAYCMYGFPTQTEEETLQALETVRRLMEEGALHSAYWHRFALTAHSEISENPDRFKVRLLEEPPTTFARNEIPFDGGFDHDLDAIGDGLRRATYNYQLGLGLDLPVTHWF